MRSASELKPLMVVKAAVASKSTVVVCPPMARSPLMIPGGKPVTLVSPVPRSPLITVAPVFVTLAAP